MHIPPDIGLGPPASAPPLAGASTPAERANGLDESATDNGAPALPLALVELLARYDPERAERARRLAAGPAPAAVLVLGPAEQAVGWLAAALAARLPALVRCAPVDPPPARDALLAGTRALVWVFEADAPLSPALWARLAELAGEVDEVHLAAAGTAGSVAPERLGRRELADRLAEALPRLAAAPIHRLEAPGRPALGLPRAAGGPVQARSDLAAPAAGRPAAECPLALFAALAHPAEHAGYRNALRTLDTGLAQAATRLRSRLRRAERRAALTDRELRRRRDELVTLTRATGDWSRRLRADLGQLKLTATAELSSAARELRDAARQHLARADRSDRVRFPSVFRAAVERRSERVLGRFDELFGSFTDPWTAPASTRVIPALAAPDPADRARLEERLMPLLGASGGLGVGRLAVAMAGGPAPAGSMWNTVALPVAVGLGVAAGWWLARARRAIADRARLSRWVAEVLVELRGSWEAVLMERLLDAERRLVPVLDREVAERAAQLAAEAREHDRLTRTLTTRRSRLAQADASALAELTAAREQLAELLAGLEPPEPAE